MQCSIDHQLARKDGYVNCHICDKKLAANRSSNPEEGWISVNERMPQYKNEKLLVIYQDPWDAKPRIMTATTEQDGRIRPYGTNGDFSPSVHYWMSEPPMPVPFKRNKKSPRRPK